MIRPKYNNKSRQMIANNIDSLVLQSYISSFATRGLSMMFELFGVNIILIGYKLLRIDYTQLTKERSRLKFKIKRNNRKLRIYNNDKSTHQLTKLEQLK